MIATVVFVVVGIVELVRVFHREDPDTIVIELFTNDRMDDPLSLKRSIFARISTGSVLI